ncbi:GDP-L-fucose synthase [Paraburkholderia phenazinium]|uniref:GDP-L-fucose synthase n=1 Tax=Paraburkholderia phenazinium TaxID=60549 RepID=A0A1G7S6C7_9BURK|nr:GDP-L-fucose synthase [Paraburkholderia phenazinium]SDG18576.1 GDP-L-fucose synthase [Paraburkholderia phenazinium]
MNTNARVYVAGHRGMVGSAIVRRLREIGYQNIITRSHSELDLLDQHAVKTFFSDNQIDEVYLAAAKVGGIHANNSYPAEFIYENLMIEANVIHASYQAGVRKLLFLGSTCIYPKFAEQPIEEGALLTGPLEPTNEPYAVAKIAGIKLCESYNRQYGTDYRSVMPTNLYGDGDNYHPLNSHVIAALIHRFHEAKTNNAANVVVWGTGTPKREFLYVDDMADASVFVHNLDRQIYEKSTSPTLSHVNVGSGVDISIADLSALVAETVGYSGEILFDTSKPDGTPRKLSSTETLRKLGWQSKFDLRSGLSAAYRDYQSR